MRGKRLAWLALAPALGLAVVRCVGDVGSSADGGADGAIPVE
jgi:hypothetical protein